LQPASELTEPAPAKATKLFFKNDLRSIIYLLTWFAPLGGSFPIDYQICPENLRLPTVIIAKKTNLATGYFFDTSQYYPEKKIEFSDGFNIMERIRLSVAAKLVGINVKSEIRR
jgi:hypothetical protein